MRTLLLAALSLSTLIQSHDADACGGGPPELRVMRLTTHFVRGDSATDRRRTFVLYGDAEVPSDVVWRMLAPMSYDGTQIADGPARDNAAMVTLIGPLGTRVVTSKKHVYLSRSWDFEKPQHAFDLGDVEGFSIAIEGKHQRASWIALEDASRTKRELRDWAAEQGVTPYDADSIYVNRVVGTKFETVMVFPKNGKKMLTFIKYGNKSLGRYEGTAMGAVTEFGQMRLVIADGANVSTVFLTNTMI